MRNATLIRELEKVEEIMVSLIGRADTKEHKECLCDAFAPILRIKKGVEIEIDLKNLKNGGRVLSSEVTITPKPFKNRRRKRKCKKSPPTFMSEYRKGKKFSQRKLGELVGVGWNVIWNIERGNNKVNHNLQFKIAEVLSQTADTLFDSNGYAILMPF